MSAPPASSWSIANQRYLVASIAALGERLRAQAVGEGGSPEGGALTAARDEARAAMPHPSALDRIAEAFGLSSFEVDLLLLAAAVELDATIAARCGALLGEHRPSLPTVGLAMNVLPNGHWSALTPDGPLLRYRLLHLGQGPTLTASPVTASPRVLHHLLGISSLDERLRGSIERVDTPSILAPSHREIAARIAGVWSASSGASRPAVQLQGEDRRGKLAVAGQVAATMGLGLHVLHAVDLPTSAADREEIRSLWEREAVLLQSALLLDCDEADGAATSRAIASFTDRSSCPLFLSARAAPRLDRRALLRIDVEKPAPTEQLALWREAMGEASGELEAPLEAVLSAFDLGADDIHQAAEEARALAAHPSEAHHHLWAACRMRARPKLDDLAQRIDARAGFSDLVLPAPQYDILRTLAAHVRSRRRVYEQWGFEAQGARGLGIGVLFAGVSGTGKTMAAEVLARELALDLYRVDLSQVVSKYIGETEKNLRRVFDAADEGSAILLFDEADALFGKRSDVKDSHDRYANIEVGYLLQRMETYRGLAILTTNMKNALDQAFLRRLRFVVTFPFPDVPQRADIWRRVFPRQTPTEGLDVDKLARLTVTGGVIRSIALNAAFLAADAGEPVKMAHLKRAAKAEAMKLEKPALEVEIVSWA